MRSLCGHLEEASAINCLATVRHLVARSSRLQSDGALFVEASNILHHALRTLNPDGRQAVLDVAKALVTGDTAISDGPGPIIPSSSLLYAVLELAASAVLRVLPHLNPTIKDADDSVPGTCVASDCAAYLATASEILAVLPGICLPENR